MNNECEMHIMLPMGFGKAAKLSKKVTKSEALSFLKLRPVWQIYMEHLFPWK